MEFPRQEYWSGLLCPALGDVPDPEIKPMSLALAGGFLTTVLPGKSRGQAVEVSKGDSEDTYLPSAPWGDSSPGGLWGS